MRKCESFAGGTRIQPLTAARVKLRINISTSHYQPAQQFCESLVESELAQVRHENQFTVQAVHVAQHILLARPLVSRIL